MSMARWLGSRRLMEGWPVVDVPSIVDKAIEANRRAGQGSSRGASFDWRVDPSHHAEGVHRLSVRAGGVWTAMPTWWTVSRYVASCPWCGVTRERLYLLDEGLRCRRCGAMTTTSQRLRDGAGGMAEAAHRRAIRAGQLGEVALALTSGDLAARAALEKEGVLGRRVTVSSQHGRLYAERAAAPALDEVEALPRGPRPWEVEVIEVAEPLWTGRKRPRWAKRRANRRSRKGRRSRRRKVR